jgi:hypothetical protein
VNHQYTNLQIFIVGCFILEGVLGVPKTENYAEDKQLTFHKRSIDPRESEIFHDVSEIPRNE